VTGVVLAGGLGTRLRTVLPDTPKSVAPVEGRPFLFFLLEQLTRVGISPVILCTGHRASQVLSEIGNEYKSVPILYSQEEHPLGTAGALRLAWHNYPETAPWLLMNGDSFVDVDLRALIHSHERSGLAATITAVRVENGQRYGTIEWDEGQRITAFREKSAAPGSLWINGGVYVFERAFLDALPDRVPLSLEVDVFPAWVSRGIHVFASEARFIDIGTPESYALAQRFFSR
jgi:NDP-sugar pyrophosphorylase family protein